MTKATETHTTDTRIGHLEQELTGVKTDVSYIRTQLADLTSSIRSLASNTRTNWQTLGAWAAVIIAGLIYHGELSNAPTELHIQRQLMVNEVVSANFESRIRNEERIYNLEKSIDRIEKALITHASEANHPHGVISITENLKGQLEILRQELEHVREEIRSSKAPD